MVFLFRSLTTSIFERAPPLAIVLLLAPIVVKAGFWFEMESYCWMLSSSRRIDKLAFNVVPFKPHLERPDFW